MISSLVSEREARKESVVREINQKWGYQQTITGPFFTSPVKSAYEDKEGETKYFLQNLHVLPGELKISGEIDPEIRYRSIYEAVLYNSQIKFEGAFTLPDLSQSSIAPETVQWDKAAFSVGISDMRGIRDTIVIHFEGEKYARIRGLHQPISPPQACRLLFRLPRRWLRVHFPSGST